MTSIQRAQKQNSRSIPASVRATAAVNIQLLRHCISFHVSPWAFKMAQTTQTHVTGPVLEAVSALCSRDHVSVPNCTNRIRQRHQWPCHVQGDKQPHTTEILGAIAWLESWAEFNLRQRSVQRAFLNKAALPSHRPVNITAKGGNSSYRCLFLFVLACNAKTLNQRTFQRAVIPFRRLKEGASIRYNNNNK